MVALKRRLAFTTVRGFISQNIKRFRTGRVKHLDVHVPRYVTPCADTTFPLCFTVAVQLHWSCAWDRHSPEF